MEGKKVKSKTRRFWKADFNSSFELFLSLIQSGVWGGQRKRLKLPLTGHPLSNYYVWAPHLLSILTPSGFIK